MGEYNCKIVSLIEGEETDCVITIKKMLLIIEVYNDANKRITLFKKKRNDILYSAGFYHKYFVIGDGT